MAGNRTRTLALFFALAVVGCSGAGSDGARQLATPNVVEVGGARESKDPASSAVAVEVQAALSETPPTTLPAPTASSTTPASTAQTSTAQTSTASTTVSAGTMTSTTGAPPAVVAPAIGSRSTAAWIHPEAGTTIPVYDTAWQMFGRATVAEADSYFAALRENGFTGTWSGIIHHAPATWNASHAGGGQMGWMNDEGELILSPDYLDHARRLLDAADRHGMKVGVVAAWQNLYLPGGGADAGVGTSDVVRGSVNAANAHAYGVQLVEALGDHPAVSMWVFGGDAGTNNTEANKQVWREMAAGVRAAGSRHAITYHTPTSEFDQLNYAGEAWLDFISPETGHGQDAETTRLELVAAKDAYNLPVWAGEARYFNINFDWVPAAFRNPGVAEMEADALAAREAGVSGYVYGDAGRWTWCAGFGDSTPCSANDIAASFGPAEAAVVSVFR